jgi:hypothetical protein
VGSGPASEEGEGFCGLGRWFGDVRHDHQAGIGRKLYAVIGEGDVADHRMVEVPGTGFIASATAGG